MGEEDVASPRGRSPLPGMMIHQDGSSHQWVPGKQWDLIVTMDDATNEQYSMFFVEEEGTWSSFKGIEDVIAKRGLFCSLYTDRATHYWNTPEAGGKVDKVNLTQFGEAMKSLRVEMIPAYSPKARGRSERAFRIHQERLPKELALAGIVDMANRYLSKTCMPTLNTEFSHAPREEGSALRHGWAGRWRIYCARHSRGLWARTTASGSRGLSFRFPRTLTGCTM
ncbi:MAG: hypothetical protein OEZ28_14390 [Nitrospinota bacterium]|nr:hypothetical protein [Nitrospinota bacterium]